MRHKHIFIDLTPVLPGGENGGVKVLAVELVRQFGLLAPDWDFTLLITSESAEELRRLQGPNLHCLCQGPGRSRRSWSRRLGRILPVPIKDLVQGAYRRWVQWPRHNQWLRHLEVDLVFCPFTRPFAATASVPVVSVICDLQFIYYPRFFTGEDRAARNRQFREAVRWASRLICISDFVRATVLANAAVPGERVVTIPIALPHRLKRSPGLGRVSERWPLRPSGFLLYPANFWPHKNHAALLDAFARFRRRHPHTDLKLVCPGAQGPHQENVRAAALRLELEGQVVFPGFVSAGDLAVLLEACRAVIFPSLYEGFGMPVLEAMAFGKPVLCSRAASLPEVAGDAALYFDPQRPDEMANVMQILENNPALIEELVRRGYQRVAGWGTPATMAQRYLQVFREVLTPRLGFATHL